MILSVGVSSRDRIYVITDQLIASVLLYSVSALCKLGKALTGRKLTSARRPP